LCCDVAEDRGCLRLSADTNAEDWVCPSGSSEGALCSALCKPGWTTVPYAFAACSGGKWNITSCQPTGRCRHSKLSNTGTAIAARHCGILPKAAVPVCFHPVRSGQTCRQHWCCHSIATVTGLADELVTSSWLNMFNTPACNLHHTAAVNCPCSLPGLSASSSPPSSCLEM
jgi:hypothetical protein